MANYFDDALDIGRSLYHTARKNKHLKAADDYMDRINAGGGSGVGDFLMDASGIADLYTLGKQGAHITDDMVREGKDWDEIDQNRKDALQRGAIGTALTVAPIPGLKMASAVGKAGLKAAKPMAKQSLNALGKGAAKGAGYVSGGAVDLAAKGASKAINKSGKIANADVGKGVAAAGKKLVGAKDATVAAGRGAAKLGKEAKLAKSLADIDARAVSPHFKKKAQLKLLNDAGELGTKNLKIPNDKAGIEQMWKHWKVADKLPKALAGRTLKNVGHAAGGVAKAAGKAVGGASGKAGRKILDVATDATKRGAKSTAELLGKSNLRKAGSEVAERGARGARDATGRAASKIRGNYLDNIGDRGGMDALRRLGSDQGMLRKGFGSLKDFAGGIPGSKAWRQAMPMRALKTLAKDELRGEPDPSMFPEPEEDHLRPHAITDRLDTPPFETTVEDPMVAPDGSALEFDEDPNYDGEIASEYFGPGEGEDTEPGIEEEPEDVGPRRYGNLDLAPEYVPDDAPMVYDVSRGEFTRGQGNSPEEIASMEGLTQEAINFANGPMPQDRAGIDKWNRTRKSLEKVQEAKRYQNERWNNPSFRRNIAQNEELIAGQQGRLTEGGRFQPGSPQYNRNLENLGRNIQVENTEQSRKERASEREEARRREVQGRVDAANLQSTERAARMREMLQFNPFEDGPSLSGHTASHDKFDPFQHDHGILPSSQTMIASSSTNMGALLVGRPVAL